MTLPDERTRAVLRTRDFLVRLSSPYNKAGIKRIPKAVRQEALRLLRHYPLAGEVVAAAERAPHVFDAETAARHAEETP